MVDEVLARLQTLFLRSRQPATLSINSKGGNIAALQRLEAILESGCAPAPLIMTAEGQVRSAAAYLLVMGHYAYANPDIYLHFHGVRYGNLDFRKSRRIRREDAMQMLIRLDAQNRRISGKMAEAAIYRLLYRFQAYRLEANFDDDNFPPQFPAMFGDFVQFIGTRLRSQKSRAVITNALAHTRDLADLLSNFAPMAPRPAKLTTADSAAQIWQATVAHQLKSAISADWTIDEPVAGELMLNYLFLRDLLATKHETRIADLIQTFGRSLLRNEERSEFSRRRKKSRSAAQGYLTETAGPRVRWFWCYTMALCRRLMAGQNPIPSADAYWMGLVDEVLGTGLTWQPALSDQRRKY
jgi:hypothetical protein